MGSNNGLQAAGLVIECAASKISLLTDRESTEQRMVTIRLARHGSKKSPFYHITVADRARSRDGRFIERVGFYNPLAKGHAETLRVDVERIDYWLSVGAQPSQTVKKLVQRARALEAAVPAVAAVE
jgi:small subunit ribosomal protein S16